MNSTYCVVDKVSCVIRVDDLAKARTSPAQARRLFQDNYQVAQFRLAVPRNDMV
jgi:hypothetical protein